MSKLTIDPIKPYLFGFTNVVIAVVGAGGTGGYLLQSLARLLVHLGRPDGIRVVVFDGDHVEEKNVGRQLFSHAEIGRNKAETLVRRFNLAFGLQMIAIPEMADEQLLRDVCRAQQKGWIARYATLLCGCVDTTAAREQIDLAWSRLANHVYTGAWLDCGNGDQHGQVLFGTDTDDDTHGALATDFCAALPLPSILYPQLIEPAPAPIAPITPANCAVDLAENRQGLNVNQMIATIGSQYLHDLFVSKRLTRYETSVDLSTMSMASKAITVGNLARSLDVEPAFLTAKG